MSVNYAGNTYFQCSATGFPGGTDAKTLTCWLNITDIASLQGIFNAVDPTLGYGYQLGMRNNLLTIWNYGGTPIITTTIGASTWFHCAYTYSSPNNVFYINGIQVATTTTAPLNGAPTITQIGGNQWSEYPRGILVEDMRLYNRVLSLNEIITVMNSRTEDMIVYGMVAWWPHQCVQSGITMAATDFKEVFGNRSHSLVVSAVPSPVAADDRYLQRRQA